MTTTSNGLHNSKSRTLIFSFRNIFRRDLFRCPHYEFEDAICRMDSADLVAPQADPLSRRNQLANNLAFHGPILLKPEVEKIPVHKKYDLFFALCGHPRDFLMLEAVRDLRNACTTKICMIDELWIKQMDPHSHFLEVLKSFDLVIMYYSQSVKVLSERLGIKCVFVPPGIDSLLFCPYPNPPQRVVDVYSVGRRSQITHEALLKLVSERGLFYLHDSIGGTEAIDRSEHRALLASVAKRSRYFIVNPGLIDRPDRRGDQMEIGNRYFEGAGAGTIMIGERPANGEFERLFDWPDALIHLPYDSANIGDLISDLDRQPERQETIRRTNVVQALLRHDWAYRWESILQAAGREPLPPLIQRKEQLLARAESVQTATAAV